MDVQLKKGLLDAYMLALLNKKSSYGYELLQNVLEVMVVSESTLYPILRRLEMQGYLDTFNAEYNGRLRKYYKIRPEGVDRLMLYKKECLDLKKIINAIFA